MKKSFLFAFIVLSNFLLPFTAFSMDKPDLEGWIVKIDTVKSTLHVLSANPDGQTLAHDRKVIVKPGMIGNFKINDYIQVKFREDLRYALMIEKSSPKAGAGR